MQRRVCIADATFGVSVFWREQGTLYVTREFTNFSPYKIYEQRTRMKLKQQVACKHTTLVSRNKVTTVIPTKQPHNTLIDPKSCTSIDASY